MFPCFFAEKTFGFHSFGGRGGFNLSPPIGGAANGIPRNLLTDLYGAEAFGNDAIRPSISPYFVDTITDATRGNNAQNMDVVKSVDNILLFRDIFFYITSVHVLTKC